MGYSITWRLNHTKYIHIFLIIHKFIHQINRYSKWKPYFLTSILASMSTLYFKFKSPLNGCPDYLPPSRYIPIVFYYLPPTHYKTPYPFTPIFFHPHRLHAPRLFTSTGNFIGMNFTGPTLYSNPTMFWGFDVPPP